MKNITDILLAGDYARIFLKEDRNSNPEERGNSILGFGKEGLLFIDFDSYGVARWHELHKYSLLIM